MTTRFLVLGTQQAQRPQQLIFLLLLSGVVQVDGLVGRRQCVGSHVHCHDAFATTTSLFSNKGRTANNENVFFAFDENKLVRDHDEFNAALGESEDTATKFRRVKRWEAAVELLEATVEDRRRFDHRASKARLVGIYVVDKNHATSTVDLLVAVQPDRSCGRKFIFIDSDGTMIGHLLVESSSPSNPVVGDDDKNKEHPQEQLNASSALRGMFVHEASRGKGYSKLFLGIWMRLCLEARIVPSTTRINKPLLALTLQGFGFSPLQSEPPDKGEEKPKKRSLVVGVTVGEDGWVSLYSEFFRDQLLAGFSATEMSSQRLVILAHEEPGGGPSGSSIRKDVHIRTQFEFLAGMDGLEEATNRLLAGGLRLSATQGGTEDGPLTPSTRLEVVRALCGRI